MITFLPRRLHFYTSATTHVLFSVHLTSDYLCVFSIQSSRKELATDIEGLKKKITGTE